MVDAASRRSRLASVNKVFANVPPDWSKSRTAMVHVVADARKTKPSGLLTGQARWNRFIAPLTFPRVQGTDDRHVSYSVKQSSGLTNLFQTSRALKLYSLSSSILRITY